MDTVHDGPHLITLTELNLSREDSELLTRLASRFAVSSVKYLLLERGRSTAIKVILKPKRLFPFLVKLDGKGEIRSEMAGDRLLRLRVPPLSIPPLEAVEEGSERAAIMYRYVTGGRVRHPVDRLDVHLGRCNVNTAQEIISDIFDIVLKKCHWLDGELELRTISLEDIEPEPGTDTTLWSNFHTRYESLRRTLSDIRAPHAVVHGDLHPKNVLITRSGAPVLIDFRFATTDACIYADYAKLEAHIQFQAPESVTSDFWHYHTRLFSSAPLILPRSATMISACIHTIRSILWKNCLSSSVGVSVEEIDIGYRGFLARNLLRFISKAGHSPENKKRAAEELDGLLPGGS